jgi:hypothetical protein
VEDDNAMQQAWEQELEEFLDWWEQNEGEVKSDRAPSPYGVDPLRL